MTLLESIQTRLLNYEPGARREQEMYFSVARNLSRAQFKLADQELCRRLWQDVGERNLDVDRVLNLMYGCWFQDDQQAMLDADADFLANCQASRSETDASKPGIFEHC